MTRYRLLIWETVGEYLDYTRDSKTVIEDVHDIVESVTGDYCIKCPDCSLFFPKSVVLKLEKMEYL